MVLLRVPVFSRKLDKIVTVTKEIFCDRNIQNLFLSNEKLTSLLAYV